MSVHVALVSCIVYNFLCVLFYLKLSPLPLARRLFPSSKREEEKTYLSLSSPFPPTSVPKKDRLMCNRRFPTKKQREADSNSKSEETQNKCDLFLPSSNPTRIRGCGGGGGGKRQTHLLQSRDSCAEGAPLYKSVYVYVITTENNCVHTNATLYIYTCPWICEWRGESGGNKSERRSCVIIPGFPHFIASPRVC